MKFRLEFQDRTSFSVDGWYKGFDIAVSILCYLYPRDLQSPIALLTSPPPRHHSESFQYTSLLCATTNPTQSLLNFLDPFVSNVSRVFVATVLSSELLLPFSCIFIRRGSTCDSFTQLVDGVIESSSDRFTSSVCA